MSKNRCFDLVLQDHDICIYGIVSSCSFTGAHLAIYIWGNIKTKGTNAFLATVAMGYLCQQRSEILKISTFELYFFE